jgi:hypothetical protein
MVFSGNLGDFDHQNLMANHGILIQKWLFFMVYQPEETPFSDTQIKLVVYHISHDIP